MNFWCAQMWAGHIYRNAMHLFWKKTKGMSAEFSENKGLSQLATGRAIRLDGGLFDFWQMVVEGKRAVLTTLYCIDKVFAWE
jgi:hypothetical protein